jgi:4-hydroxybenzoate polyprenyltransferase
MNQTDLLETNLVAYLKLLRIDHWIKNLFMLPGVAIAYSTEYVVANRNISSSEIYVLGISFVALCFASSANYVINEWLDRTQDAKHPFKNHRVSNRYKFSSFKVFSLYLSVLLLTLLLTKYLNNKIDFYIFLLVFMGFLYNVKPFRLKDKHYLDVMSESINNPIRFAIGWHVLISDLPVPVSAFIGFWGIGIFLMALKRYSEMSLINDPQLLGNYRKSFLYWDTQKLLIFAMVGAMVASSFIGIFLVKHRVEYILLFPMLIWIFSNYLKISLDLAPVSYQPEMLMREKKLISLVVALGGLFVVLTIFNVEILGKF